MNLPKITLVLLTLLSTACIAQNLVLPNELIGNEKYNDVTIIYIDNIKLSKVPTPVFEFFYKSNIEFKKSQIEVQKEKGSRLIMLQSKKAKSGYLYVNSLVENWVNNRKSFNYMIDSVIVNTLPNVIELISLKRSEIDTIILNDAGYVQILTLKSNKQSR